MSERDFQNRWISPRFRDALHADRIRDGESPPTDRFRAGDGVAHLRRQLGMCEYGFDADGLFTWLVQELDPLMNRWPPVVASDDRELRSLVSSAVEGLDAAALLEVLHDGPSRWRKHQVDTCTVAGLATQLRAIVIKSLTAELRAVISRWVTWDVPNLRHQPHRPEVIDVREPRQPRPVGKARTEKLTRPYVPPGKT